MMTQDETFFFCMTMQTVAGGFCQSLALAWERADPENQGKLEAAFPNLIEAYGPGSAFYQKVKRDYEDRE